MHHALRAPVQPFFIFDTQRRNEDVYASSNRCRLQRAHAVEHALFTLLLSEQPDNVDPASAAAENLRTKPQRAEERLPPGRPHLAQTERKSAYAKAEAEAILLTQLACAKGQTVDAAKDYPSPERCWGFVYSLPEIARLIGRAARLAEANFRFVSGAVPPAQAGVT